MKGTMRYGARCLTFLFLLMPWIVHAQTAISLPVAAVSGDFVYAEKSGSDPRNTIRYRVQPATYRGVPSWHILWRCRQIQADHFIRRRDGAPLYTRRINHALGRIVEIFYSPDGISPHIYRLRSRDAYIERRIDRADLLDIGALPQMLLGLQKKSGAKEIHFASINYDDGKVYALVAKRIGYSSIKAADKSIRCAIFEVNLDSWKAAFNTPIHILTPASGEEMNFAVYSGPDPADTGNVLNLHLIGRNLAMASLERGQMVGSNAESPMP